MQASTPARTPRALVLVTAVLAAALVLAGCQTLRSMSPQARRDAETAARLLQLQQQNMRFADNYVMRLMTAARLSEHWAADPMQRYHLSGWLLAQARDGLFRRVHRQRRHGRARRGVARDPEP